MDPVDKRIDWTKDLFGNHIPSGPITSEQRQTTKFNPIEFETVSGYIRRLMQLIHEQEQINTTAHTGIAGKKMWFTHRTPSECWICSDINAMWVCYESLVLVASILPDQGDLHQFRVRNNKLTIEYNGSLIDTEKVED